MIKGIRSVQLFGLVSFFVLGFNLLLSGCGGESTSSGNNVNIATKSKSLAQLYEQRKVKMSVKDSDYKIFNATAETLLKMYSGTPYLKYVEDVIVTLAKSQDPSSEILGELVYCLYGQILGEDDGVKYDKLTKIFLDYSELFKKDFPFYTYTPYEDIANEEEIIDARHYLYLRQFDKANKTKLIDLDDSVQATLEYVLKLNVGGKLEKMVNEITIFYDNAGLFKEIENDRSGLGLALWALMGLCGVAEYGISEEECIRGISDKLVYSETFRKANPDLFKNNPMPNELINLYKKVRSGDATANEKETLPRKLDLSTQSIIKSRLEDLIKGSSK